LTNAVLPLLMASASKLAPVSSIAPAGAPTEASPTTKTGPRFSLKEGH